MLISGTSQLSADREEVWQALNDPAVLVHAIPGCTRLESIGDDAYKMTVAAGVGAIKGVYDGEVRLHDQQAPGSFRMRAQGAGAPGTIGADVVVTLEAAAEGGTELTYHADATVGGMIGGVGQRMLTGVSKKMAAEFFGNVDGVLAKRLVEPVEASQESGVSTSSTAGRSSLGLPPGPSAAATPPSGPTTGRVFTAPPTSAAGLAFPLGVAVGAVAALAGALVGGWLSRRRN